MEGRGKFRYQVLNFFLELVLFILHSFLNFPAHIRRIIICFVYSKDHQPALAYSFFKQVDLPPSHVIDVKDIHPLQTPEEDEVHKHFFNQYEPYDSLPSPDFKVDLLPSTFPSVVNNQPVEIQHAPNDYCPFANNKIDSVQATNSSGLYQQPSSVQQPTDFQFKVRGKMFGPLKLPSFLHPYPLEFLDYLPTFSGKNNTTGEEHLSPFQDFIDNLEILHEDIIMRIFSKYLIGYVALWFKNMEVASIGSWDELYDTFLKYWGERKSFDHYLNEFTTLRRGKNEVLSAFNRRFHNLYCSLPLEIKPSETVAMVYYIVSQHSDLVFYLRERKSTSLSQLFIDAKEVEENL
jgi:hypothetical protein